MKWFWSSRKKSEAKAAEAATGAATGSARAPAAAAAPKPAPAERKTEKAAPAVALAEIPPGSFRRSDSPADVSVITRAFRMGVHEITRAQFLAVMGKDPSNTSSSSGMDDPAQRVSWYHAIAFCNKLSLREGLAPAYAVAGVDFGSLSFGAIPRENDASWNAASVDWEAGGYRLPTETEWQWAAMGAQDARGKPFAGYKDETTKVEDYAWNWDNSSFRTQPVGSKLPNELGLYDMSGNVCEWCWDWYGPWPSGTLTDYRGCPMGGPAVQPRYWRGGSHHSSPSNGAVGYRGGTGFPYYQYDDVGFRIVRA